MKINQPKAMEETYFQEVVVLGNYCCYSGNYLWKLRNE